MGYAGQRFVRCNVIQTSNACFQGGNVYEAKCRELGIPVSAAVAEGLNKTHAGLARAYIGRLGARALGHALACNTCIESLDLTDNSIDGQVMPWQ
jgi:hypothetical protein